jgi:hypothetical protein
MDFLKPQKQMGEEILEDIIAMPEIGITREDIMGILKYLKILIGILPTPKLSWR